VLHEWKQRYRTRRSVRGFKFNAHFSVFEPGLRDFFRVIAKFANPASHQGVLKAGVVSLLCVDTTLRIAQQPTCCDLVDAVSDRSRVVGVATDPQAGVFGSLPEDLRYLRRVRREADLWQGKVSIGSTGVDAIAFSRPSPKCEEKEPLIEYLP